MMFTSDSFARHMPVAVAIEQRMAFEAYAFSSNVIELNYHRIREFSLTFTPWSKIAPDDNSTLSLFDAVWSIIDHCHNIIQINKYISNNISIYLLNNFSNNYNDVTNIRNSMDHISQQISNFSKKKGRSNFLHGSISYASINCTKYISFEEWKFSDDKEFFVSTIAYGSHLKQKQKAYAANPISKRFEFPVDCYEFSAFEKTINISSIYHDLIVIRDFIEAQLKLNVENQLRGHAKDKKLDPNDIVNKKNPVGLYVTSQMCAQKKE